MKKLITGKGLLQHHFWGNYSATILLRFPTAADCEAAVKALALPSDTWRDACGRLLKSEWNQSEKQPEVCGFFGGGETLEKVIKKLVELGGDKNKIESMSTSVDRGEPFTVNIEIESEDKNQLNLF